MGYWAATRLETRREKVALERAADRLRLHQAIIVRDESIPLPLAHEGAIILARGAVWKVAERNGAFGALVRPLLLSAQRREKVVTIRWQDISMDGVWTIPTEEREKGNAMELVLHKLATDIIHAQPQFGDNPYVLAGRGVGHINAFSKAKRSFDEKLAAELPDVPQWQLHDLRRTARSLMSRAKVSSEHAEKVMGHKIPRVESTYDRHEYMTEKRDALPRLAALVDSIVNPPPANVVPLRAKPAKRGRRRDP